MKRVREFLASKTEKLYAMENQKEQLKISMIYREKVVKNYFFLQIAKKIPDTLVLVMARDYLGKKPLAGALNFQDSNNLYGRYWGCLEEYDSLHFESCYYQGIEHCIENKLKRFDPGVQGEHKIKRGFLPVETYSAHWIKDDRFKKAIEDFLVRERMHILDYTERCKSLLPFKNSVTNGMYSDKSKIKRQVS